jgi:hypothetical protein
VPSEIIRLFLAPLFGALCVPIVFSVVIHVPYFRWLLRRKDPSEYRSTGGWMFFSSIEALGVSAYFLKREYLRCEDKQIRRHGSILRWTFAIPLVVSAVLLPLMLIVETATRAG